MKSIMATIIVSLLTSQRAGTSSTTYVESAAASELFEEGTSRVLYKLQESPQNLEKL